MFVVLKGTVSLRRPQQGLFWVQSVCKDYQQMTKVPTSREGDKAQKGSAVVECLTRDRGAPGSSLTGVTAWCLEQDTLILA